MAKRVRFAGLMGYWSAVLAAPAFVLAGKGRAVGRIWRSTSGRGRRSAIFRRRRGGLRENAEMARLASRLISVIATVRSRDLGEGMLASMGRSLGRSGPGNLLRVAGQAPCARAAMAGGSGNWRSQLVSSSWSTFADAKKVCAKY